jgi:glutathione S-transferase
VLKLWGRDTSFNVQKVLWALGEIGLPFDHVEVGGRFGGLDTAEFLARNPHGRIPVIEDEGTVLWESNSIVRYLSARYAPGLLSPEGPAERARCDQWMDWEATTLQPAFIGFFWGWYRTPEPQRSPARNAALLAAAHAGFGLLDVERAGKDLDRLTMGDIPMGALLYRYFTLEIERPRLARLEAWYGALCEREAYRRAVMIPYDELKGRLAF